MALLLLVQSMAVEGGTVGTVVLVMALAHLRGAVELLLVSLARPPLAAVVAAMELV
jgi:hypothetical protein